MIIDLLTNLCRSTRINLVFDVDASGKDNKQTKDRDLVGYPVLRYILLCYSIS